jgi:hypothetical protein
VKSIEPNEGISLLSVRSVVLGAVIITALAFGINALVQQDAQIKEQIADIKRAEYAGDVYFTSQVLLSDGVHAIIKGHFLGRTRCPGTDILARQAVHIAAAEISAKEVYDEDLTVFTRISSLVNDRIVVRCGVEFQITSIEIPYGTSAIIRHR